MDIRLHLHRQYTFRKQLIYITQIQMNGKFSILLKAQLDSQSQNNNAEGHHFHLQGTYILLTA